MRVSTSLVFVLTLFLMLTARSGEAAEREQKKATVAPGGEVLVYGHKNWDRGCQPLPVPTIKVTRAPANGAVDVRPGTFVIDGSWHPDANPSCIGRSVPGLGVYYRANSAFSGVDTFEYEVTLGSRRQITFGVEAQVKVQ